MGEGGVKNPKKMLTSFMDGPLHEVSKVFQKLMKSVGLDGWPLSEFKMEKLH